MQDNVGVIGLGAMGLGVARSLLRAGFAVHACDVRASVLEAFASEGGVACTSPAALADSCDILITVVVNAEQTEAVLFGEQGAVAALRPGSLVIACATVAPAYAVELGERLAERGILLLDAPLSGGAAKAASGEMTMMTSGSAEAYAKGEAVLAAMAGKVYRLGDAPGHGSKVKIINQLLAGVHIAASAEAMALGLREVCRPGSALRGHHPQRRQFLDVRESRAAHPQGRLHPTVRGGHLRQGPGPGAGYRAHLEIPAAAVGHRSPDVHAGLHRRLRP
ncbi:3-hydroxyisobutyrate dehydrogenase-like beta-hydroxyacid dehydrogenase [Pseudomonas psychrotolerans]|nr:3-hydroxyisobutyrate dehydrogenase-like beta-hydroxyacid dehydrogenase [Pseudomonas psychrotolerans]